MKVPRSLWRAASGRWRLAVLIAVAVVLPGGVGAGTMAMMPTEADPSSVPGLNGRLPFQEDEALEPYLEADMLAAVPVGADPVSEPVRAVLSSAQVIDSLGQSGIPSVAVDAYVRAAGRLATEDPRCGIRWTLLAAIGRVESNHGRFGGAMLRDDGYPTKPIRGIPLDGRPNVALISDTDRGALDGDTAYDRAVGPMQFIPSTWRSVGVDGNGDGRRDPNNLFDAAYGAARYLCDGDADLRNADARAKAVRRYNNADEYVRVVAEPGRHVRDGCGRTPAGDRASADGADSPAAAVTRAAACPGRTGRADDGAERPGAAAGAAAAGPAGGAQPGPTCLPPAGAEPARADHRPEHHGATTDDRSSASADHVAAGDPTPADHVVDHDPAYDRTRAHPLDHDVHHHDHRARGPAARAAGAAGHARGTARGGRLGARNA